MDLKFVFKCSSPKLILCVPWRSFARGLNAGGSRGDLCLALGALKMNELLIDPNNRNRFITVFIQSVDFRPEVATVRIDIEKLKRYDSSGCEPTHPSMKRF